MIDAYNPQSNFCCLSPPQALQVTWMLILAGTRKNISATYKVLNYRFFVFPKPLNSSEIFIKIFLKLID